MAAPRYGCPDCPLGMPMINHRAVTLLHYPPIVALQHADYLHNNTLIRWQRLLDRIGVPDVDLYHSILDVNPIAAPGSGESEYPNDFFPINLTSLFFDNDFEGLDYVRSMLELTLDPPANAGNPQTLPLLVCGSPTLRSSGAGAGSGRALRTSCRRTPGPGRRRSTCSRRASSRSGPTARSRRPT